MRGCDQSVQATALLPLECGVAINHILCGNIEARIIVYLQHSPDVQSVHRTSLHTQDKPYKIWHLLVYTRLCIREEYSEDTKELCTHWSRRFDILSIVFSFLFWYFCSPWRLWECSPHPNITLVWHRPLCCCLTFLNFDLLMFVKGRDIGMCAFVFFLYFHCLSGVYVVVIVDLWNSLENIHRYVNYYNRSISAHFCRRKFTIPIIIWTWHIKLPRKTFSQTQYIELSAITCNKMLL